MDSDVHSSLKSSPSFVSLKGFRGCPWTPWTCVQVCVCVCVFTPLLEEAEPYFSLGLGGWSQNNTDSNSVKTSVETPGSSLSVPSQYPDFPSENLQFSLRGRHLPSFLSFWALHGIELHVVVSFLLLEVQCEQLFYYRNVWFECLRAKDLIYAAT